MTNEAIQRLRLVSIPIATTNMVALMIDQTIG
jgi:hypothetical protein